MVEVEAMAVNQMKEKVVIRTGEVKCIMHQKDLRTGDAGNLFKSQ
jgi:hypothetical protein